jgi:peptidyl-prolyl cis-trans isomerase D
MLTTIREKTQGIIASFILALIAIPFALWGVNSYLDSGMRSEVASVNGEKISEQEYRDAFRRLIDPRVAESPEIKKLVVEQLLEQALVLRDAEAQGYRLSDERLATMIRELPYLQSGGRFDPALYQAWLRREGKTMHEFESRQRVEAAAAQIYTGLVGSGIVTTSDMNELIRLLKQERDVAYAVVTSDRFHAEAKITPEAIQQYYDAHPDLFRTQEQVRIEYVRLSAQDLVQDYRPSDAELRQRYEEDPSRIARPESRMVSHILVTVASDASEDDAKQALSRIQEIEKQVRAGGDFAQLARKNSQDTVSAPKGGDLGELRPGVLPKTLEDAVVALKPGAVSAPVRTPYGYHLAKLTSYKPAVQRSLEELRPQLVKQLRQRHSEERYYETSEKFRNAVYEQSDSLAPAAQALGVKVETTDWFSRAGGMGVAAHPRVIEAAFSAEVLQQKKNSDAFELSGDTLIAVRAVGHKPSEPKPFADVKAQIERTLRQEAARKATREFGENVVKELTAGQSWDAALRKHGLRAQGAKTLSRDQAQGVDRSIVDAAFRAPRPENGKSSFGGVDLAGKGYAVYAVTRVREGDPAKADTATKDKAKRILAVQRGVGYYADYRAGLKQKADIKINQERL